jgi:hypothetical protein
VTRPEDVAIAEALLAMAALRPPSQAEATRDRSG